MSRSDKQTADDQLEVDHDRLEVLREEAAAAHQQALDHMQLMALRMAAAGARVAEAKVLCPPGEWAAWLAMLGLPDGSVEAVLHMNDVAREQGKLRDVERSEPRPPRPLGDLWRQLRRH